MNPTHVKRLPVYQVIEDYVPLAGRAPCKYDFIVLDDDVEVLRADVWNSRFPALLPPPGKR